MNYEKVESPPSSPVKRNLQSDLPPIKKILFTYIESDFYEKLLPEQKSAIREIVLLVNILSRNNTWIGHDIGDRAYRFDRYVAGGDKIEIGMFTDQVIVRILPRTFTWHNTGNCTSHEIDNGRITDKILHPSSEEWLGSILACIQKVLVRRETRLYRFEHMEDSSVWQCTGNTGWVPEWTITETVRFDQYDRPIEATEFAKTRDLTSSYFFFRLDAKTHILVEWSNCPPTSCIQKILEYGGYRSCVLPWEDKRGKYI